MRSTSTIRYFFGIVCFSMVAADIIPLSTNDKGYPEYRNEKDGSILIEIPAGSFTMGTNDGDADERPAGSVTLDRYLIGKYEVTLGQWKKFVKATGYRTEAEKEDGARVWIDNRFKKVGDASWRRPYFYQTDQHPVTCVSWNDAQAYCLWAGLRLPSEAEWEMAARGTERRKFPWGNDWFAKRCNSFYDDPYPFTAPVGSFPDGASPYGAMDMAGNVWEWCADWYHADYYQVRPDSNPHGPATGYFRVSRGGSWGGEQKQQRCALRQYTAPSSRYSFSGFRVACTR